MHARPLTSPLTALMVAAGVLASHGLQAAPPGPPPATPTAPTAHAGAGSTAASPGSNTAGSAASSTAPSLPVTSPEQEAARVASQLGLQLSLMERGPEHPWLMKITNLGSEAVLLTADAKLLYFEVDVPGQKKPTLCMLPEAMRAGGPNGFMKVPLEPGEVVIRHLDPRFYCFAEGEQSVLVPGAVVKPRYGWPPETKTVWQKGKRVVEVVPPAPPFAAIPLSEAPPMHDAEPEHGSGRVGEQMDEGPSASMGAAGAASTTVAPSRGIRLLEANAFALGPGYAVWSEDGADPEHKPVRVRVTRGSDSDTERGVTVTVALSNQSDAPLNLFFRRELVSFEVLGPTGSASCKIEEDFREPERQAFLRLAPGKQESFVTRLVEMCPRGTFLEPGLYLVGATLHARYAGERFDLHAFVGEVQSLQPKPVRVRKREEPFLTPAPPAFRTGGTQGAAAAPMPAPTPPPPPPPAPVEGG